MDDLSPKARSLLEAARFSDDPSDEDRRRIHAHVLLRVGGAAAITAALTAGNSGTAAAAGGSALGSSLFGGTLVKIGAAAVLVGGLGSSAYVAFGGAKQAAPQVSSVSTSAAKPAPAPAARPAEEAPEPSAPVTVEVEEEKAPPAKSRTVRAQPTKPLATDLDGEVALLRQADSALRRGDTNAALAALATHASEYPRGALRQEREGVRAIALCRGGRTTEGRAQAARFVSAAPKSPLGSRIRAACWNEK